MYGAREETHEESYTHLNVLCFVDLTLKFCEQAA